MLIVSDSIIPHTPLKTNLIIYEFPLSERIRVFMRLEQLFLQIDHFINHESVWDRQAALNGLLDILTILSRNDIKSDIIMQVERNSTILGKISHVPDLDLGKLKQLWFDLEASGKTLYEINGKVGFELIQKDFLKSISQRRSIPGGTCAFDLPEFYCWLQQPDAQCKEDLQQWLSPLNMVRHAIDLILHFIRLSAIEEEETANAGYYQQSLDRTRRYHLLRIGLERTLPYYAEVSGGKQRFTVRFMNINHENRAAQTNEPINFQITRCLSH